MKDLGLLLNLVFVNSWKQVIGHLTGKRKTSGGHMSGFGFALELLLSYVFVIVQLLLLIIVGLAVR